MRCYSTPIRYTEFHSGITCYDVMLFLNVTLWNVNRGSFDALGHFCAITL